MNFDIRTIDPVVSVCLITYNHAPYIRECLDSILSQETAFPYEICLGEDESNDGTREICEEYATRHPNRIRLFLRSRVEPGRAAYMSQGVYNHLETVKVCRGKYLACCDGDDAWTDPLKLQKQFEIMESHPQVSLVHSDFDRVDEIAGNRINGVYKQSGKQHQIDPDLAAFRFDVIQQRYSIAASTVFIKTKMACEILKKQEAVYQACPMGDTITWCELINYGSFHLMQESTAIYRILPESDSNSLSPERRFRFINGAANFGVMLGEAYHLPMKRVRANKIKNCNRYALMSDDFSEIQQLYAHPDYPFSFMEYCIYQAGKTRWSKGIARRLFEERYRHRNGRPASHSLSASRS